MRGPVTSVAGKTVLVVGLGNIGLYFARLVKAVGAHVIGVKRRPTEQLPDCADAVYQMDRLQSLLPQADVVASVLPGTQQTRRIFGGIGLCGDETGGVFPQRRAWNQCGHRSALPAR